MKKILRTAIIPILFILLGYVLSMQFKNVKDDYSFVSLRTMTELQNALKKEKEEIVNIKELIRTTTKRLDEYQRAIDQDGSIRDVLEGEIKAMKIIAGFVDLEGPGIVVRLRDSERELYEGENPNNVIVHDGDVLMILNDLKTAGAEALSINGQRIMSTSEIKCAGPTITINNYTYGQPFIIKAIGDTRTLEAAIKAPNAYATYLREVYGIIIESEVMERVRIPKFQSDLSLKYVTPEEGE